MTTFPGELQERPKKNIVILGGGLTGLSAGSVLTKAGFPVQVYERDAAVGGLSKTVERNGFRFDLGGHRFFTRDEEIETFVRELMGNELVSVDRSSKIYLRNKYFDYPLRPFNAMFGLGIPTTVKILADYVRQSLLQLVQKKKIVSLEDWVVAKFGRTMFELYFKEYSEKVWGIDCSRICATWVERRINGMSLATAVKNAFFKFSGRNLSTLTDSFLYPSSGIGRISERLREEIEKNGEVFTDTPVVAINHADGRAESITVESQGMTRTIPVDELISSIPVTSLVHTLHPSPPARILEAAANLRFRDLVVVAIMVNRARITDQTWIYIPEKKVPFGRIHEPTNWSADMAPPGKSLLVMEFFCFRGDAVWNLSDAELTDLTIRSLVRLGFIKSSEALDSEVVRVPHAYPLFEVGHRKHADVLYAYLERFENIHSAGRCGMFQYYNMDVALRSGIETAGKVMRKIGSVDALEPDGLVLTSS